MGGQDHGGQDQVPGLISLAIRGHYDLALGPVPSDYFNASSATKVASSRS